MDNFQFNSSDSDSSDLCDDMIKSPARCLPSTSSTHENVLTDFGPPKSKRARKEIMSPRVSAALDKCKVSDRDCVHLLTAVLETLEIDPSEYIINRTSIKISREKFRQQISERVRLKFDNLNLKSLVLHWDSKILPDITGKSKVDRLPVVVTALNMEQLLGVPEIKSSTGKEISSALYHTLQEWSLENTIQAFVFDTTASNTGRLNGVCHLLEQKLDRNILYLACRHHIYEIVLHGVFSAVNLVTSTGPDIIIFKKFKNEWRNIEQNSFSTWSTDENVKNILKDISDEILKFAKNKIKDDFPRDDYKELLELIIIFLGGVPPQGIHFRAPGAYHLARWMAKAIYCLKIFLFRKQFKITQKEEKELKRICCFIVKCYAKPWFSSTNAIIAPMNDIYFLKTLNAYKTDDKEVAEKAISKIINHLWYLNEECAAFSIFDERINNETRMKMAQKILQKQESEETAPKKYTVNVQELNNFLKKDLPLDLLGTNSIKLFERFNIAKDFLEVHPKNWNDLEGYQKGKEIIDSLRVVNDTAERGVKLMEEFNDKFTKNEDQKQFVLQVRNLKCIVCFIVTTYYMSKK